MPRLFVRTRQIDPVDDLLAFADPTAPLAWLRRGDGIVACGDAVAAFLRVPSQESDAARTPVLARAWQELAAGAAIDDPLGLPGTGLVGFGALVFDQGSESDSVIIVPRQVIGRHQGRTFLTTVSTASPGSCDDDALPISQEYGPHWAGSVGPGAMSPEGYQAAVGDALAAIDAAQVSKVVVARDLAGTVPPGADLRRLVRALASGYPDTWVFAIDGLIGASPETLVTAQAGTVTARVLAGTIGRGADPDADTAASASLASSTKDLDEHQYAVQSVLSALRPHARALASSEQPFLLRLPNLFHLATDVEGELSDGSSALDLVGALHPTAAVAGTPTDAALALIRDLEPFDRGRYAGPVGWVDADGNGEWAIALRCAQFETGSLREYGASDAGLRVTAFAGAGIVAGSDPEAELLETRVKFRPIVDALA